ncbi:Invasion protein IagB precursor [Salmonella bongori]|nr:Invasion protein IagB precursor [Salmonella bongori]
MGDCWLQAEKMFNIESELLYAIAQQESAMKTWWPLVATGMALPILA